jgi:hypothetical protein
VERNERGYCTSPKIIHKNTIFIHKVAILLLFQTFPQSKNKNRIYKIIKLHALSLLFVGSFNVLGTECKIKNEDLIYEITSSVYSYSNDTKTGTCKCKAGYKFRVDMISTSIQALIASRKDNLFTASFVKEGKKLQCATPKDDTELSPAAWTISISIFSVVAIGSLIKSIRSYYISRNTRNTDTIEMLDRKFIISPFWSRKASL